MSNPEEREKHSKRIHKTSSRIKKQQSIALSHAGEDLAYKKKIMDEAGRFAKHHAMDCGDPKCFICGNPRKVLNELTVQEKRLFQDLDTPNDRHSNGIMPEEL